MTDELTASIAFVGEAYDTAADFYRRLEGYTVRVEKNDGARFDATVLDVRIVDDEGDGFWHVELREWLPEDDHSGTASGPTHLLDIYDDIDRVVVL